MRECELEQVETALMRLRASQRSGDLAHLCQSPDLDLLVLFGSVVSATEDARDVDLACARRRGADAASHLEVVNALGERFGDVVGVMDLDAAGSVDRYEALHGLEPLFEGSRDRFAEEQIAAVGAFVDTRHRRERLLALLAE